MRRTLDRVDLLLNLLIVTSTLWAVVYYFYSGPDILGSVGAQCFKYFTTDSNVLALLSSLLYLVFRFTKKKDPEARIPQWLTVFKFVSTVAVSITLLTVVFFLAPMGAMRGNGWTTVMRFFTGNVLVLHLTTPVLAIISTLFLEKETITRAQALLGVLPSTVYGAVYLLMVVVLKRWNDWYGFTFGGRLYLVPVVAVVMLLFAAVLSLAERRIKNR